MSDRRDEGGRNYAPEGSPPNRLPKMVVKTILYFIGSAISGLIITFVVYMAVWYFYGYDYSLSLLKHVLLYQSDHFMVDTSSVYGRWVASIYSNAMNFINSFVTYGHHVSHDAGESINNALSDTTVKKIVGVGEVSINNFLNMDIRKTFSDGMIAVQSTGGRLVVLAGTAFMVVLTKLILAMLFLPFYTCGLLGGAGNGFFLREIRKSEAARESTTKFFIFLRLLKWFPIYLCGVYLFLPINVSPSLVMIIGASSIFILTSQAIRMFKRYL